jgi:DNA polymerase-3 subunit delta
VATIFIRGDDGTLVAQAVQRTVARLVGDGDRSLMVEELTEESYGETGQQTPSALVSAAQTPPFLTERRVVIGRHLTLFSKAATVLPLVELLAAPPETTDLVLVWDRAANISRMPTVPKTLSEALKSAGAEIIDAAPSGRARKSLLDERLANAPVRLDAGARRLISEQVGDEVGRLSAIFDVLVSTFGLDAKVGADDVLPFLGNGSDLAPWELTDAIDSGDIALALEKLDRMTTGGGRHPLQLLATLHNHYQRALRLDGASISDERSAAAHLGMTGSTFPAKKALILTRRLGSARLGRIIHLLSQADLDVRGATAVDGAVVMEVLVARLARLSR